MKGIILHGGHGTRLRPLTHTGPKQLLPIANKPMSQYALESLIKGGIVDIAIIVGGIGSSKVKDYYGDGKKFGANITYVEQNEPKGIAHAIGLCKNFVGSDKFVVFLGDNILDKNISEFVQNFDKSNVSAMLLLSKVINPSQFGIATVKNDKIIQIVEKPKNSVSNLAVTGIYFLTNEIFTIIESLQPSWRNELEISDALQLLIEQKKLINFDIVTDYWKDTGTPTDILHANQRILQNLESYSTTNDEYLIDKNYKLLIGNRTNIQENCKIIGPVIIGQNCIIDQDAKIGPNVSIGDNSKLSACDIENSIIMENCEVNCKIKIRDSIIASGSKILQNVRSNEKIFLLGEGTKVSF